jgi:hypothetical protein
MLPHAPARPGARALLAALLALALLPLLAPGARAAAAPKPCGPGQIQVRVAVKAEKAKAKAKKKAATRVVCRKVALTGDPRRLLARATPTPARLRALAPRRLRARIPVAALTRAARALDATPATTLLRAGRATAARRVTARTAAAGDCSAPYKPGPDGVKIERDGVTMTGTGGTWGTEGGPTAGKEYVLHAAVGDNASMERHQKDCVSWDTCPDADGLVHGEYHYVYEETRAAEAKGIKMTIKASMKMSAKLVGHVGADGRVTTFDWDGEGTGTTRTEVRENGRLIKLVPHETVRVAMHQTGADPRNGGKGPQLPSFRVWGLNGALLDGTAGAGYDLAKALILHMTVDVGPSAAKGLLAAEKVFYDQAACLDVVFDPQPANATPNAKIPVSVKVKAKDGAEVAASYDAQPVDGAVGPPTGTTPATVTWTAPDKVQRGPFETFKVVAVSKRGRAIGTHTARGPEKGKWWTVTIAGTGDYHRYEPRGIPFPQLWSDFTYSYKMVSLPVRLPYFDNDPARLFKTGSASVEVTGDLHGKRTDGGGTSTCAGTPMGESLVGWVDAQGAGGGFDLSITPFPWIVPESDAACGTFADMLHSAPGFDDGIRADTHVTQADLDAKDRIELAVDSGATPLKADCRGGAANGDWPCTHTMSWKATVVLERTATPAGEQRLVDHAGAAGARTRAPRPRTGSRPR